MSLVDNSLGNEYSVAGHRAWDLCGMALQSRVVEKFVLVV